MKDIGESHHVRDMYNDHAPYPGRFIEILDSKNSFKQKILLNFAKTVEFDQDSARAFVISRLKGSCPDFSSQLNILDIGCGTGEKSLKYAIAFPNAQVTAIDFSASSLKYANKLKNELGVKNIEFCELDFNSDELTDRFDIIQCSGVLHHMEDPETSLKLFTKLLKPGGMIWLFLYANYGCRYAEKNIRKALRLLFPSDKQVGERVALVRSFGMARDKASTVSSILVSLKSIVEFSLLWFSRKKILNKYTEKGERDLYDGFAHPIVWYYDYKKVRQLIATADLELIHFNNTPNNPKIMEKIKPYLKGKNILEQLRIVEYFLNPNDYQLLLKPKR